jgi:hypothetical protein
MLEETGLATYLTRPSGVLLRHAEAEGSELRLGRRQQVGSPVEGLGWRGDLIVPFGMPCRLSAGRPT